MADASSSDWSRVRVRRGEDASRRSTLSSRHRTSYSKNAARKHFDRGVWNSLKSRHTGQIWSVPQRCCLRSASALRGCPIESVGGRQCAHCSAIPRWWHSYKVRGAVTHINKSKAARVSSSSSSPERGTYVRRLLHLEPVWTHAVCDGNGHIRRRGSVCFSRAEMPEGRGEVAAALPRKAVLMISRSIFIC